MGHSQFVPMEHLGHCLLAEVIIIVFGDNLVKPCVSVVTVDWWYKCLCVTTVTSHVSDVAVTYLAALLSIFKSCNKIQRSVDCLSNCFTIQCLSSSMQFPTLVTDMPVWTDTTFTAGDTSQLLCTHVCQPFCNAGFGHPVLPSFLCHSDIFLHWKTLLKLCTMFWWWWWWCMIMMII